MASPPADVVVLGSALDTLGFEGNLTIAGLGLNTKGFLWPCSGIWSPSDFSNLHTTWVPMLGASIITTWNRSDNLQIQTIWTAVLPATVNTETCVDADVVGGNAGLGQDVLGTEDGNILGTEDGNEIASTGPEVIATEDGKIIITEDGEAIEP